MKRDTVLSLLQPLLVAAALAVGHAVLTGNPLLTLFAAFVLAAWLRVLFVDLFVGPCLWVPRDSRFGYALSRVLIAWHLTGDGVTRNETKFALHLRAAIRAAPDEATCALCTGFLSATREGRRDVAAALAERLRTLLQRVGPRMPATNQIILPKFRIRTLAILAAFAISLWYPATDTGAAAILFLLAAFLLARAILLLAYEIWFWCRLGRNKAAFRTLLVSDQPLPENELNRVARELYWRVGHVIAIEVNRSDETAFSAGLIDGSEAFEVTEERLGGILGLLDTQIDLLVVLSTDMDFAARVLEGSSLPRERRRVINPDGHAPPDFPWIETASLFLDPPRIARQDFPRPPLTRYNRWMPGDGRDIGPDLFLSASIPLLWVYSSTPLITLSLLLALLATLAPYFHRRRSDRLSATWYRAPRNPEVSAKFRPEVLQRQLFWASALLTLLAWIPVISAYWDKFAIDVRSLANVLIVTGLFSGPVVTFEFARLVLVSAGLLAVKLWLERDFRILLFRRNSPKHIVALVEHMMVTCGTYGQVIALDHPTLRDYDTGFNKDRLKEPWIRIFAEPDDQILMGVVRPFWRKTVLSELEFADFAVFDWSEEVTDAMVWELKNASLSLPPERMLVVLNGGVRPSAEAALATLDHDFAARLRMLEIARDFDTAYIWSDHTGFGATFRAELAERLQVLKPAPRLSGGSTGRGVWPFPRDIEGFSLSG